MPRGSSTSISSKKRPSSASSLGAHSQGQVLLLRLRFMKQLSLRLLWQWDHLRHCMIKARSRLRHDIHPQLCVVKTLRSHLLRSLQRKSLRRHVDHFLLEVSRSGVDIPGLSTSTEPLTGHKISEFDSMFATANQKLEELRSLFASSKTQPPDLTAIYFRASSDAHSLASREQEAESEKEPGNSSEEDF